MSILVGYGQYVSHINENPDLKNEIYDLSTVSISRYNPDAPKTSDPQVMLKRSPRYCFNVSSKSKQETTAYRHSYYFDSIEKAKEEHRKLKIRLYDQLTAPILQRLKSSSRLNISDQVLLDDIIAKIDSLG